MTIRPLVFALAVTLAAPAFAEAQIGQAAPAFTALDSNGKPQSLAAYRGKTVVLEWTNADCPFVKKHYGGNMQALQKKAKADGVVWLTVNSGAPGQQGHVDGAAANAIVKAKGAAPSAYLLDPKGNVGHLYAAKTTPHMYVVDPKGTLVYAGGIDDTPTADVADLKSAKNYVTAALADMKAGRAVGTPRSKAYGCSVKYAS